MTTSSVGDKTWQAHCCCNAKAKQKKKVNHNKKKGEPHGVVLQAVGPRSSGDLATTESTSRWKHWSNGNQHTCGAQTMLKPRLPRRSSAKE